MTLANDRRRQNRLYNQERIYQAKLAKRDLERDKALEKLYQESYNRIQDKIDKFYLNYADKNGLTLAQAKAKASEFDVQKYNQFAKRAVKSKDFSQSTNKTLKLYNLKMKVSRLELLQSELAIELQNLGVKQDELLNKARLDELQREIKRQAGILGSTGKVTDRIKSILDADFYGASFSERVWAKNGLYKSLERDLFGSLNRIYTDMTGFKQERNRLAKKFDTSKNNAQRLLKTEITRINTSVDLNMMKDNGFDYLIYVTESKPCPICSQFEGMAIKINEGEAGVNLPPMHPNCRCSFYAQHRLEYKDGRTNLDDFTIYNEVLDE